MSRSTDGKCHDPQAKRTRASKRTTYRVYCGIDALNTNVRTAIETLTRMRHETGARTTEEAWQKKSFPADLFAVAMVWGVRNSEKYEVGLAPTIEDLQRAFLAYMSADLEVDLLTAAVMHRRNGVIF